MRREVLLTQGAEHDLEDLYRYIAEADSPASAAQMLERLLETTAALSEFPERGSVPKELRTLGIQEYRQVFFKPYRVVYRVMGRQVIIHLIADGRRDMQTLLTGRLLRA